MLRHVVRLALVVLATTMAGLVVLVGAPSAQAATCGTSSGVSVVVDFHQLGSGVHADCDADGAGQTAREQFAAYYDLTFVAAQPFVCKIDGAPASAGCARTPPADAYWSLWWSDGKSGKWIYASSGVDGLKVPAGGYVAFSWQQGTGQTPPGIAPTAHTSSSPSTTPTSHATTKPTHKPGTGGPSSPSGASSATSSPTAGDSTSTSPTGSPSSHPTRHHASKTPSPSDSSSDSPSAASSDGAAAVSAGGPPDVSAPGSGSGLPGWVAPAVVGALFVAAGAVALVRRKRAGGA